MSTRGRPTKCTPEVIAEVARVLRSGCYAETACDLVGISHTTYYNWLERGRAELARVAEDGRRSVRKPEEPFVEFLEAVTRASAASEVEAVAHWRKAMKEEVPGDWRAAESWCRRRFPKRWNNQQVDVEHSGRVQQTVVTVTRQDLEEMSADDAQKFYRELVAGESN